MTKRECLAKHLDPEKMDLVEFEMNRQRESSYLDRDSCNEKPSYILGTLFSFNNSKDGVAFWLDVLRNLSEKWV